LKSKIPLDIIFFYKIIIKELQIFYNYIIKNLAKGFIILNFIFFVFSILIT
ncbi:hypothetical protein BO78DRAFT_313273, partial [Aspergillus sclerotiicarbonarius CBS 121057]